MCNLWITAKYGANILSCSTVTHLDIGDEVKVTGDDAEKPISVQISAVSVESYCIPIKFQLFVLHVSLLNFQVHSKI